MTPMQRMAESAARGKLALQRCTDCGAVQYPPRELCVACLADGLQWRETDYESGEVLADTTLHHSHEAAFREVLPMHVGLVQLDLGPSVICFLGDGCNVGARVRVTARTDAAGRPVLSATLEATAG